MRWSPLPMEEYGGPENGIAANPVLQSTPGFWNLVWLFYWDTGAWQDWSHYHTASQIVAILMPDLQVELHGEPMVDAANRLDLDTFTNILEEVYPSLGISSYYAKVDWDQHVINKKREATNAALPNVYPINFRRAG